MTSPGCPACGDGLRPWTEKDGIRLDECNSCGTVRAATPPAEAGLYDGAYSSPEPAPPATTTSLMETVRRAEAFRRTGRWLDVGYGQGDLLEIAASAGWACHGTEVSAAALERGRSRHWTVAPAADDPALFPAGGFDVVTIIETLEHVADPAELLREARRLVRPGGLVHLTTPNVRSLNRRLLGAAWSVVCPPDHLTLFTRRGLARALSDAGLAVLAIRAEGFNPAEIVARFRARQGTIPPVNRQAAAVALSAALSGSRARSAVKRGINAVLDAAGVGDTLKAWAVAP